MKIKSIAVILMLLNGCSIKYTINIKTIPNGVYNIRIDNKVCGKTPFTGDTTIITEKIPFSKSPILELKDTVSYGYLQLNPPEGSIAKKLNVYSVTTQMPSYHVTFIFDIDKVPKPLTEIDVDLNNNRFDFLMCKKPPKISYCILGKDTNSYSYFGLKRHVDRFLENNHYSWSFIDTTLQKQINEQSLKFSFDSLAFPIWQEASQQNIKYLVMFYGYSINGSKGVAPSDVGASLAITSLGIIAGSLTGFYLFAIPNGQSDITKPTVYCAIYSVNPNRCIYKGKETMTSYNSQDIRSQITTVLGNLFKRIDMLLCK